jgi:hypothetical protein
VVYRLLRSGNPISRCAWNYLGNCQPVPDDDCLGFITSLVDLLPGNVPTELYVGAIMTRDEWKALIAKMISLLDKGKNGKQTDEYLAVKAQVEYWRSRLSDK